MARIPMTSGFALIPEGTYVFRIYDAKYDEEFGKIEVKLVNAAGMTHTERFFIKDKNDEMNEKALNAFSLEDIDPEELIDHFICAEVVHTKLPSNKDPNKMVTFANLGDKSPAEYFDTEPVARALSLSRENGGAKNTAAAPKTLTHCWDKGVGSYAPPPLRRERLWKSKTAETAESFPPGQSET